MTLKNVVKQVNRYFFGSEYIAAADAIWFYGFIGFMATAGLFAAIINCL